MSTVAIYQARNVAITATIEKLESQQKTHRAEQAYNKNKKEAWLADMTTCSFLSASKNRDCNAANDVRKAKADAYQVQELAAKAAAENITNVQIPDLNEEFNQNLELIAAAQLSAAETARVLAGQGLTYEGSTNKSTLQGEGDKSAKTSIGKAQAESLLIHADVDSQNKKNVGYAVAAGGFLMVVIVAVVLFKKIKNR